MKQVCIYTTDLYHYMLRLLRMKNSETGHIEHTKQSNKSQITAAYKKE